MQAEIRIAIALIVRDNADTLLLRKRGVAVYLQSGGKIEGAETPRATLAREMHAALGLKIPLSRMTPFGCFETAAANIPDHMVVTHVFRVQLHDEIITPAPEIEEAIWVPIRDAAALPLAPLTRDHILTLYWQMRFCEDRFAAGTEAA